MTTIVLTADVLARCTGASLTRATMRCSVYNQAIAAYGIDQNRMRLAFFLANVGVESGGFAFSREIWGPTATQAGYEGRADLGNTQPGDGFRFRGAGDISSTGRFNFAKVRDRLRKRFPDVPDFEADPDQLGQLPWAALSAADFIDRVGANQYADALNFDAYCDVINRGRVTAAQGDANGFQNRLALAVAALRILP